jgi:hypothetical protein
MNDRRQRLWTARVRWRICSKRANTVEIEKGAIWGIPRPYMKRERLASSRHFGVHDVPGGWPANSIAAPSGLRLRQAGAEIVTQLAN